ncbi:MAG: alpha/beta hydrolase [Candidatus Nitrosopolaris sp.]
MPSVIYEMKILALDIKGVIVPNSGHWIPEEQPQVVIKTARQFL